MEPRPENELAEDYTSTYDDQKRDSPLSNALAIIGFVIILGLLIWFFGSGSGTEIIQH